MVAVHFGPDGTSMHFKKIIVEMVEFLKRRIFSK